jgi:hypothetical protein
MHRQERLYTTATDIVAAVMANMVVDRVADEDPAEETDAV